MPVPSPNGEFEFLITGPWLAAIRARKPGGAGSKSDRDCARLWEAARALNEEGFPVPSETGSSRIRFNVSI
jgi:hypothetical protein